MLYYFVLELRETYMEYTRSTKNGTKKSSAFVPLKELPHQIFVDYTFYVSLHASKFDSITI